MDQASTISKAQQDLNKELHSDRSDFGNRDNAGGVAKRLPEALAYMIKNDWCNSFLDYGCGKGGLVKRLFKYRELKGIVQGYDPAVDEFSQYPQKPVDILSCLDVLEHIELNTIDNVIDDIKRLTKNFCFVVVDLQPAVKHLSDGRNAHILLAPKDWWVHKFNVRFASVLSFPLRHKSNHDQKIVILATNDSSFISPMITFAKILNIFGMKMTGGTLGKSKVATNK